MSLSDVQERLVHVARTTLNVWKNLKNENHRKCICPFANYPKHLNVGINIYIEKQKYACFRQEEEYIYIVPRRQS